MANYCPECGHVIEHLRREIHLDNRVQIILEDGEMEYINETEPVGEIESNWYCPDCRAEIASTSEEAERFLDKTRFEMEVGEMMERRTDSHEESP